MREFRYLTFDCYGTLVDWRSGIEEALADALGQSRPTGVSLPELYVSAEAEEEGTYKPYRDVLADTALRVARGLGIKLESAKAREFANSLPSWPAFGDTATALKQLGSMGFRRYILSNVDRDLLEQTISRNGLEVDGFVTAEETGSYKPSAGHWTRFMEKTGAKREETLHVAQSIFHDIVPTHEIGIASAWVNRYREPIPSGVQPSYIVDSLASLVRVLD